MFIGFDRGVSANAVLHYFTIARVSRFGNFTRLFVPEVENKQQEKMSNGGSETR